MKKVLITALGLASALNVRADHPVEEVEVRGVKSTNALEASGRDSGSVDATELFKQMPGAEVNSNGPLSPVVQYRGMYGDRVDVKINGASFTSGGPNAMDAPLHYAPLSLTESITVIRGIAPVSAGQQTIGGAVQAKTMQGEFASQDSFELSGIVDAGVNTAYAANQAAVQLVLANKSHKLRALALNEQGDDAEFTEGEISPTEYKRERQELAYAIQHGAHSLSLTAINNETDNSGTPALAMDIAYVDTSAAQVHYGYKMGEYRLDMNLLMNDAEHAMDNFQLRQAPMSPMMYRSNLATGKGLDFSLQNQWGGDGHLWRVGVDWHQAKHESDITNPNNANFLVINFNQVETSIAGVFVETEQAINEKLKVDAGLRVNQVSANSGKVNATGLMPAMQAMADMRSMTFNQSDRKQSDTNVDAVAKLYWQTKPSLQWMLGLGHKTRSASYQERYLWMPMEATGGLADARTYVGTIDLDPEQANEIELGLSFEQSEFMLAPRIFYRDVADYIQGTPTMMTDMNGNTVLQFNNVDAKLYGFDMPWALSLTDHYSLQGGLSAVRGERKDIDDNLYRISPDNASLALNYAHGFWQATLETQAYARQNRVSDTNSEKKTPGYALVNLHSQFNFLKDSLQLKLGVNNILDKHYLKHLGGYNRVANSDVEVGDRLPGVGRNVYAKLAWSF